MDMSIEQLPKKPEPHPIIELRERVCVAQFRFVLRYEPAKSSEEPALELEIFRCPGNGPWAQRGKNFTG